jgi:hypothetical protein
MLKHLYIISVTVLSMLFIGCTVYHYVPIQGENTIKTEYKEIVRDSIIYIPIEKDIVSDSLDIIRDTLSVLSNKYSVSTAEVKSGTLNHHLETKYKDSIQTKIIYKDIVRVDSVYVTKPIITEVVKPIRDNLFWYSIIGNVIFLLILLVKLKNLLSL